MTRVRRRARQAALLTLCALGAALEATAATRGRVIDLNGQGLPSAMVTLTRSPQAQGPTALTAFTDEHGSFAFPSAAPGGTLSVRLLGYRQVASGSPLVTAADVTLLMRPEANQAGT